MPRSSQLTIVATTAAAVMVGIDFVGVASVLTEIERDLDAGISSSQWMLNLYALTFGMGIVAGGKLGDTFGHRKVLLIGLGIFAAASLGVVLSSHIVPAIGFRGAQGVGGALIWPTIIAISFNAVPASRSAIAIGIVVGGAGFGNVLGPLLGGAFSELATWKLLFAINIPISLLVGVMALRLIPREAPRPGERNLDLLSTTALALALLALIYSLDVGSDWGWTSPGVIALWAGALGLLAVFGVREPRSSDPLIPPALMRDRGFVAALLANGLITPAWFSFFVYVPQYLQKTLGYSPFEAGAGLLPAMAAFAIVSPIGGRFYARFGPRLLIGVGYAATAVAALNLAIVEPDWGYWGLLPGLLLVGAGAGMAIPSAGSAAVGAVDAEHSGAAGGLSFMFHLVIGAAGVAIGTALFASQVSESVVGDEFAVGMHAAMWFCAAVAVLGIANSRLVRTKDVRGQGDAEGAG